MKYTTTEKTVCYGVMSAGVPIIVIYTFINIYLVAVGGLIFTSLN